MLELNNNIQPKNTVFTDQYTTSDEQANSDNYDSLKQILTALACISFFPLLYLIGSTLVKYFG